MSASDAARRACRDVDPEVFFAPEGLRGAARTEHLREAKAVCAGCPVRLTCLDVALTNREQYGVFGGLDEDERRAVLRRRRRKAAAA
jgi:WhiB family redox-sensing transcriptional regulator